MSTPEQQPQRVIQNLLPKQRFQQSADNLTKHRSLVDSREFERGTDFAMLQYCIVLTQNLPDDKAAAAAGYKMAGAMEYLLQVKMLGEVPPPAPKRTSDNLKEN